MCLVYRYILQTGVKLPSELYICLFSRVFDQLLTFSQIEAGMAADNWDTLSPGIRTLRDSAVEQAIQLIYVQKKLLFSFRDIGNLSAQGKLFWQTIGLNDLI